MIHDFGYICTDLTLDVGGGDLYSGQIQSRSTTVSPGGRGLNQALAAARMGAKVSLIGVIGEDLFGREIVTRLQREGITTAGIARSREPTGMILRIHSQDGKHIEVLSPGANAAAKASQVPMMALNARSFMMLQDDVPEEENLTLLRRARLAQAQALVNFRSERVFHVLGPEADYAVIAQDWPVPPGFDRIVIKTLPQRAIAQMPDGSIWTVDNPCPEENFNYRFAEDCFCGALAACLQAGYNLPNSMEYARAMSNLAGDTGQTREKLPYLDEVEAAFTVIKKNQQAEG